MRTRVCGRSRQSCSAASAHLSLGRCQMQTAQPSSPQVVGTSSHVGDHRSVLQCALGSCVSALSCAALPVDALGAVADAPASSVKELKTDQEYRSVLQEAAKTNALSVFDYTAAWCGPCELLCDG
jgi:thiol:disulfide interchange protein